MPSLQGNYFLLLCGLVLLLAAVGFSAPPAGDKLKTTENEIPTKSTVPETEDSKTRSFINLGMDNLKDMFDWGSVTWVPLGSLLFGNQGDGSIGIAKWPIGNDKNNNKNG